MPRPQIDLRRKILEILDHLGDLPQDALSPVAHHTFGANAAMNMRRYMVRQLDRVEHNTAVRDRHFHVLDSMVIVNLIQAFERFIKDIAALCVDRLSDRVNDSRFDDLSIRGGFLAAHFTGSSPGRALCESDTWLNCRAINDRFRKFLQDPPRPKRPPASLSPPPPKVSSFDVFPVGGDDYELMSIIWQLRHSLVHNVGEVTRSDAAKLKVLARRSLDSPKQLLPEWDDVRFLRTYLDERVNDINQRLGRQLATVLTALHFYNDTLFAPQDEANLVSSQLRYSVTIAGATGVV